MHDVLGPPVCQLAFNQLVWRLSFSVLFIVIISYSRSNQLIMMRHIVASCSPEDRTARCNTSTPPDNSIPTQAAP
jgi:hypothetical protein